MPMNLRLFRPEVFQGNLKKKHYFEGWYFKHVSHDLSSAISFIPGVSLIDNDPHAFIQIMDGITGKSDYIRYPVETFSWDNKRLFLQVGSSTFTDKGINVDIENENLRVTAKIEYDNIIKYPKSLLSPGIMGWYSFIPFMECNHGIVSVNHDIKGELSIDGNITDFNKGKGYIEKDWGTSFPEAWIWIQCNNFNEQDASFTFSLAKIPWMGRFFIGFIAYLYINNRFYLFSTYNKATAGIIKHDKSSVEIDVKRNGLLLRIKAIKNSFNDLRAPVSGVMSRSIKESIDSEVFLQLFDKNNDLIYEGNGKRAGMEVIEKIFDYM